MENRKIKPLQFYIGILTLLFFLLPACGEKAKQTRVSTGNMDTPAVHVQRGDDALANQDYDRARKSYKRALELAPENAEALSGQAVADAYRAAVEGISEGTREKTYQSSQTLIDKALESTPSNKDQILSRVHNFAIQMHVALHLPKDEWYAKTRDHFEAAKGLTPNDPAPYYYMGLADLSKLSYVSAADHFKKVLSFDRKYAAQANAALLKIQKIERALPGSRFGKYIANVEKITRADVAALFVVELKLDRIYKKKGKSSDHSFSAPAAQQRMNIDPLQAYPKAVDISGHAMEDSIQEVLKLEIKGLTPDPAHKFHPDQEYKRAEFAQLIQDILIKLTKDSSLASKYVGQDSPFPDVPSDVWYYNASRIVTDRGLMPIHNKVTGAFEPMSPVSGADALLTIRTLKEILQSYLR